MLQKHFKSTTKIIEDVFIIYKVRNTKPKIHYQKKLISYYLFPKKYITHHYS